MTSDSQGPPVKERILNCALEFFTARGYDATSVREVVEAAGISKPTLYYYFGNKEGLYRAIFLGYLEDFFQEFGRISAAPGPLRDRLRAIAELHFRWLNDKPLLATFMYRAIFGILPQKPAMADELLRFRGRDTELLLKILSEAAESGEIPPEAASEFSAIRFLAHLQAYAGRSAVAYKDDLTPDLADQVVRGFLEGTRAAGSETRSGKQTEGDTGE